MKVFIWEEVDKCTGYYHENGGVVVFAETESKARNLANNKEGCEIKETEKPTYIRDVSGEEEKVFIFPDAGCC